MMIEQLDFSPACAPEAPVTDAAPAALDHQREAGLIQNAIEFYRVIAINTGRPLKSFLGGKTLEYWRKHLSHAAKIRRRYKADPTYRKWCITRQIHKGRTPGGKIERRFRNAIHAAKQAHWWPLYDALLLEKKSIGSAQGVDIEKVYKSLGLSFGSKGKKRCEWCCYLPTPKNPKEKKPTVSHAVKWARIKANPSRHSNYKKRWRARRERRMQKPHWRVRIAVSQRINCAMKHYSTTRSSNSQQLTGCTWHELRLWLESKFADGMCWDNYGSHWHIDHIIPCAAFDLSKPEEQVRCFHYTNLQPLWAYDNLRKGAGLPTRYGSHLFSKETSSGIDTPPSLY